MKWRGRRKRKEGGKRSASGGECERERKGSKVFIVEERKGEKQDIREKERKKESRLEDYSSNEGKKRELGEE